MNKIDEKFKYLEERNEKALILYFTAGFPSFDKSIEVIKNAEKYGADIIEIGVPFSDPIADGPIIQYTSYEALKNGMNLKKVFELCKLLKNEIQIPYLLMSYYNPIFKYGIEKFSMDCKKYGVSGVIVPDLPFEENGSLRKALKKFNLHLIQFITPFTPPSRVKKILTVSDGFIYYITVAGITGPRDKFSPGLIQKLSKLKKMTEKKIAAGFGFSNTRQIKGIKKYVDGVIVGSFFLSLLINGKIEEMYKKIEEFKKELK